MIVIDLGHKYFNLCFVIHIIIIFFIIANICNKNLLFISQPALHSQNTLLPALGTVLNFELTNSLAAAIIKITESIALLKLILI